MYFGPGYRSVHRRTGSGDTGLRRCSPRDHRTPSLPSSDATEYLSLRLSQPRTVEPAARTGSAAQYRADVADRAAYHLVYNPGQRWYYAPKMERDEVLLIKGWDSLGDRARFTPHSAFELPETPA